MKRQTRERGFVPSYWWDFQHHDDGSMSIVVETDDPRAGNPLKVMPCNTERADRVVRELKEGRRKP